MMIMKKFRGLLEFKLLMLTNFADNIKIFMIKLQLNYL